MLRRFTAVWVCLLLVALGGGYYAYGELKADWQARSGDGSTTLVDQPYQQFWTERLGPDTQLTYHVVFSCGHDQLITPEQMATSELNNMVSNFDQVVRTMQVESQQGAQITLTGRLSLLCQDCRVCYLVTEQDGCVAVFRGRDKDSAVLVKCYTDMPIAGLPEDVQQSLRDGIVVYSEDELARILEGLDG